MALLEARYLISPVRRFDFVPTGRVWSIEDLAATFGVGPSQMRASLARLERFGMIRTVDERTEVRTRVPALSARHVERSPAADWCHEFSPCSPPNKSTARTRH